MPRMYPATVRRQIVSRLRSGEPVALVVAEEIGFSYFVFGADFADRSAPVVAELAGR
jgi:hypothetical protein